MFDVEYQDFLFNTGLVFNYDPCFEYPIIQEPINWADEPIEETAPVQAVEAPVQAVKTPPKPFDPALLDELIAILSWEGMKFISKKVKALGNKYRRFVQFTGKRTSDGDEFTYELMINDEGLPVPSPLFGYYPVQMISFCIWYFYKHHSISEHALSEMSWRNFIQQLLSVKYRGITEGGRVFVDGVQITNGPVTWEIGQHLVITYADPSHNQKCNALEVVDRQVIIKFTDVKGAFKVVKFYL